MLCCCFLCTGGRGGGWGGAKPANESQREEEGTGRGNTGASWKCVAPAQEIMTKNPPPRQVSRGLANQQSFSEVRRGATRSSRRSTTSCNQATQPCLPDSVIAPCTPPRFFFPFRSFHAFLRAKTQLKEKSPIIIKVSSVKWFPGIHQLCFFFWFFFSVRIEALDLVIKGFFEKTTSEREEFRMNVLLKFMHRTLKMYFKPLDNVQKRAFIFNDVKLIVVFEKKKKKKKMTSSQSTGRTKVWILPEFIYSIRRVSYAAENGKRIHQLVVKTCRKVFTVPKKPASWIQHPPKRITVVLYCHASVSFRFSNDGYPLWY